MPQAFGEVTDAALTLDPPLLSQLISKRFPTGLAAVLGDDLLV